MTIALADLDKNAPPARIPGDFFRHPISGAPYVSHPTEVTKAGVPRRVMYGRPSGFGGALDNPYGLVKWKERQLLIGVARLDIVWRTYNLEDRDTLDGLAAECHEAAGSSLAADRGTHVHLLCENADRNLESHTATVALIERGIELDIPPTLQVLIVEQWYAFRARLGVTALAVEATVVHDGWQLAGTLDRLDQAGRKIATTLGAIPKGKAFIGDIKTGSLTVDNSGSPRYWVKYPVQLAAYADAVPYDTDTDTRGVWDNPPHRKIALIYHYDLARAVDGELVDWQAIPVDLNAGRAGGAAALAAKQFRPVFGDPIALEPVEVVPCSTSTPTTELTTATPEPTPTPPSPTTTNETTTASGSPSTTTTTTEATPPGGPPTTPIDHPLILATQMLEWPLHTRTRLAALWPFEYPTPGSVRRGDSTWTSEQLKGIRVLCGQVDAPWDTEPTTGINRWTNTPASLSSTSTDSSASSTANSRTWTNSATDSPTPPNNSSTPSPNSSTPDTPPTSATTSQPTCSSTVDLSGGPLDPKALDALLAACTQEGTRMVINAWLAESRTHNCYWNPRIVGTVRSFEQARAARALATMWGPAEPGVHADGDEFVRLILTTATAPRVGYLPIGRLIGELTIAEAQAVVDTVDAINGDRLTLRYTDDGVPQLVANGVTV